MISLIIPTMNRPDFLIRLLRYYRDIGFPGYICIGDSSDAAHIEPTKRAVEALQGKLNIIYREYPDYNISMAISHLIDLVSTRYAAFVADDDFLVPAALEQCAMFLDNHPDYVAAHGVGVGLGLKSSGAYGQVAWASHYQQPVIDGDSASQRLLAHLSNYAVTLFSVHRIESWREMYQDISSLKDDTFALELLPCCRSVIQGKVKELDCFYLVRQSHNQRYLLPEIPDWISSPHWLPSYQVFRGCLAKKLMQLDGIGIEKAQEIVDQAFQSYLTNLLGKPVGKPTLGHSVLSYLREVAGILPGARQVWRALRSLNSAGRKRESLLATLLLPSSPYHADFMPVYQALTEVPADFPGERT